MDTLSEEHLDWLRADRQPANTVASRSRVLRSIGNAGTADAYGIQQWWESRAHLSHGTRANDLANLRSFYRWCRRWDRRADDPTLRLDAPKVDAGLPRPVSRADLLRLLAELPDDLRRAVALGAYAGLRVSEVARLRWTDLDVEARRARVWHSKGAKSRLVAISPVLVDALLPDTGGNVVTGTALENTPAVLQRRVNRAIRSAGVDATFHQLRHRYGTLAYQATGDLLAVGRQMGHSSPVTTAIYAAASDEVADRIAAAVVR